MENLRSNETIVEEAKITKLCLLSLFPFALIPPIGFILLTYRWVIISKTKIFLTNLRLIGYKGKFWTTDYMDLLLNKITSIQVENSFLGNLLGYATLRVVTSQGTICYEYVKHANGFRSNIIEHIDKYGEEKMQYQAKAIAAELRK